MNAMLGESLVEICEYLSGRAPLVIDRVRLDRNRGLATTKGAAYGGENQILFGAYPHFCEFL